MSDIKNISIRKVDCEGVVVVARIQTGFAAAVIKRTGRANAPHALGIPATYDNSRLEEFFLPGEIAVSQLEEVFSLSLEVGSEDLSELSTKKYIARLNSEVLLVTHRFYSYVIESQDEVEQMLSNCSNVHFVRSEDVDDLYWASEELGERGSVNIEGQSVLDIGIVDEIYSQQGGLAMLLPEYAEAIKDALEREEAVDEQVEMDDGEPVVPAVTVPEELVSGMGWKP